MKSRSRRHVFATATVGVAMAFAPLLPVGGVAFADAPAVVVTGLALGSQGDAVKQVQQALISNGVSVPGGADGVFGPGTESALKQFQSWHGLSSNGRVDAATALALGLTTSPYLDLAPGDRGENVRKLQQRLIEIGISVSGGADGIFGQGTTRAVKEFQSSANFSPTGSVNAATAAALDAAQGSNPAPSEPGDEPAPETANQPAASDATDATDAAVARPESAVHDGLVGLKIGSRGNDVVTLQRTIMAAGFTVVGGADGIFGALTANALKSFQTANGLAATGVVDQGTANALAAVNIRTDDGSSDDGHDHDHDPGVSNPFVGLQYGSLGADVKALQQRLLDLGIKVRGGADGVYGFATRDAVKEFQGRHSLEQTGKVDESTANALASGAAAGGNSSLVGLKTGALGNTVKQLQQALIDAGIKVRGGADGIFGPATTNALKEFQTSQGLEATGVVDVATAEALANPKQTQEPTDDGSSTGTLGYAVYGERGARVIALQTALVEAGITLRGGVDGDFGGGTSAAVMDFQTANGLTVTGKVNEATATALGLEAMPAPEEADASSVVLGAFPVQGKCYYGDSYGYPRGGGRVHLGVDIIAPEGNLLYAVADGTITKVYADYPGSLAGNGIRLTMADGTYFFYAHMLGLADGIDVGTKVKAGQIVGAVGNTGSSGTPHLHLEIHPKGGSAINPYPLVKAIDACHITDPLPQP